MSDLSVSAPCPVRYRVRWWTWGWVAALGGSVGLVAWDGVATARHHHRASATYGAAVRAPAVDTGSPTGLAGGVREVVYPGRVVDGQHWIMQTQEMLADGAWRLRATRRDNAGAPRPVHWASPFRWWLALCGWIDHGITGRPWGLAVEYAALYANPALLALALVVLVPWTARRFGGAAAAFLALAMAGTPFMQELFAADNPDHHGLIQFCGLAMVLAVLAGGAGWIRLSGDAPGGDVWWLPSENQARRAFTVSALAGAAGLWVSAAGTIPALAGIGLGALAGAGLGRRANGARYEPALWRRWGLMGGAGTLVASLVEYAPFNYTWRLEVIHPLYALAWAGGGELLAQVTAAWHAGRLMPARKGWPRLIVAVTGLLLPVVVILAAGTQVFAVRDPFMWAMSHDYVPEGQSLITAVQRAGFNLTTVAECLPIVVVPAAVMWFARRTVPPLVRAVGSMPLAVAALFWVLGFQELRWWIVSFGFVIVAVVAVIATFDARTSPSRRIGLWAVIAALFLPGLVDVLRMTARARGVGSEEVLSLVERDLAHGLRQRWGDDSLVVLSAPGTTSRLLYFGGFNGLGTCYWENLDAMKRAAAIYAAHSWEEAHALVRAAGVTHLVFLSWDDFIAEYVRLDRGLAKEQPITTWAFGLALQRVSIPPPWLRRLPDHLPDVPPLRGHRVLIFEVTDRTRREQALTRWVNFQLYRGQAAAAAPWRVNLAEFADDLAAQVALARLEGVLENQEGLARALARVEGLLAQAPELEPEDRVNLVILFAYGGRGALARPHLAAVLRDLDERALRRLTPGALMNLLTLSQRLEVSWPDAGRREFALSLVPPDGRS